MWAFSFCPPAFARGQLSECRLSHWLMNGFSIWPFPCLIFNHSEAIAGHFLSLLPSFCPFFLGALFKPGTKCDICTQLGRQLWARHDILWDTDIVQNYWIIVTISVAKKKWRGLRESITGESRNYLGCCWWFQMFGCIALSIINYAICVVSLLKFMKHFLICFFH